MPGIYPGILLVQKICPPGIIKGRQLLDFKSGSDDMCVRTDKNHRFFFIADFAAREHSERQNLKSSKKSQWTFLTHQDLMG